VAIAETRRYNASMKAELGHARSRERGGGFDVTVTRSGRSTRLRVRGDLDVVNAARLINAVRRAAPDELLLDLRSVSFIDSSGLHALLEIAWSLAGRLAVMPSEACERLADLVGARDELGFVRDDGTALRQASDRRLPGSPVTP
jgi:anti-anti-sigma factor